MEITFKDFILLMVRRLPILILSAIVGFGVFFSYTKVTEVPMYTCEVTMIVNAAPDTITTLGTLTASQNLTKAYIAIMKDFSFSEKVEAQLPEDNKYTAAQIRKTMTMNAVEESQVLAVKVKTPTAKASYQIAKAIEEIAPSTLRSYFDDTGSIRILREAAMPTYPSSSRAKVNAVLGAGIGFVLAACIVLLLAKLDRRIRISFWTGLSQVNPRKSWWPKTTQKPF